MPQSRSACGGDPADGRDLEPGERAGVEAELVELLADGAHGVDRGEADPLVAAGDHALDGPLELLRRARRLDRDRRHDGGVGAVVLEPRDRRAGLLLGARARAPPSRTAAWSRTTTASRAWSTVDPTTASTGKRPSAIVAAGLGQGRDDGALLGAGAALGDGDRGLARSRPAATRASSASRGPVGLAEHDDGDAGVDRARRGRRLRAPATTTWMPVDVLDGQRHPGVRRAPR